MSFKRPERVFSAQHLEQIFTSIEYATVFQHGRGALSGCQIIQGKTPLQVEITPGIIQCEITRKIPRNLNDIPVPANSMSYIWASPEWESHQPQVTPSDAPIGGLYVCLGRVVTNDTSIISIDGEGRMTPALHQLDDPRSYVMRGEFLPKGALHNPVSFVFSAEPVHLTGRSRNIQAIDPMGAESVYVFLPETVHFGNWFRIHNYGELGDGELIIYDSSHDTELARLKPGETCKFEPSYKVLDAPVLYSSRGERIKAKKSSALLTWVIST